MNKRDRLKILRTNAAKAREALARKRAKEAASTAGEMEVVEIPLDLVPMQPAARTPARRAKPGLDRAEVDAFAQLVVAAFLELKRRRGG